MTNCAMEAADIRIEFTRHGDRFAHRVLVIDTATTDAARFVPLLDSREGTADDDWPASPPWQEVHCERRAGGVHVALVVGKAGRCHWSASFELDPAGSLSVDVACRAAAAANWLGSTYGIHGPVEIESPRAAVRLAEPWILQPDASDAACTIERCDQPRSLVLRPEIDPAGAWPRTIRWKYRIMAAAEPRRP